MSRESRGTSRVPPGYDDLDGGAPPQTGEPQNTLDPAEIASDLMIDRMLAAPGLREAVAAPGTAVVVLVSGREWLDTVSDSWRDTVRGGVEARLANTHRAADPRVDWQEYSRTERVKPELDRVANNEIADARWKGVAVVGFAHDLRHLPPDLLRVADHALTLGPVDASVVTEVIRRLTGATPAGAPDNKTCAAMTPGVLRLARNPGQTPDGYLRRLLELTAPPPEAASHITALDRLHGMPTAVIWGKSLARDLDAYRAGKLGWSAVDRGALLHGPTGTGKTSFARSLAATCGVPLVATSYAAWQSAGQGHMGDVIRTLREVFAEARKAAPSILFIDELDSVGDRMGGREQRFDDWWRAIINALLEQLDGLSSREGVVVIAATNHPGLIDPAILRAGRLDRRILVGFPDAGAMAAIMREHLGEDLAGTDLAPAGLAGAGCTGADCELWVRGARRRARDGDRPVVLEDLLAEIGGKWASRSPAFARRVALHEAAHAVYSVIKRPGTLLTVTVHGNGPNAGGILAGGALDGTVTITEIRDLIVMILSGRAAEESILGQPSAGSGGSSDSDLASATALAIAADTAFGFGKSLVWHGLPGAAEIPSMLALRPDMEARVASVLDASYREARSFVHGHRGAIEAIARRLMENGTMSGAEVEATILQGTWRLLTRPADGSRWLQNLLRGIRRPFGTRESADGER